MGKFNKTYLNTDSLHGTNESEIVAFISGGKRYSVNTIKDDIIKLEREDAVFQADECQCTNEQHRGMSTIQNVVFEVQANKIVQKYAVEVGFCPECNAFYIPKESRKYLSDRGKIIHPIRGAHDLFEYKTSGEAFEEERAVLKNLQKTIHRKLDRERPEGNLYETGDYDEIAQMNKSALIAFYKHENEMERFLSCPYSGRLDVGKGNAHKTYYIGGALDEDEVIEGFSVYSSWSKIGRLFYDSSEPSASEIGDSKVLLRRKIHIARGDLKGIEDIFYANTEYAEKGIYDKFLIQVLMTRKKNHQLTDIIATIQKKQREIIECALVANIIVQGCAGSGKTMVLLHRLSYWLYNNKTLNPEKIKILTPNDNFNKHIRALHSSLNLGGIGILSIEQYYNELLKKYDTRIALQRGREIADESNVKDNAERLVNYIYEKGFQKKLDKIYPEVIYQWVTYDEIDRVSRISRVLRMSFSFYPDTKCDADRTDDFGMQIKRLLESPGLNRLKKTDKEFLESMKKRYVDDAPINIFNQVFDETIKDKLEELSIEKPNHIYRYELYARLLFAEKYWNRTVGEEKIICIDEGQDVSYNEYLLILRQNKQNQCFYNVYGDLNQRIKHGRGMRDWELLKTKMIGHLYYLNENYRNTNQITEYCNEIFDYDMTLTGVDGDQVRYSTFEEMLQEIQTIEDESERVAVLMSRSMGKNRVTQNRLLDEGFRKEKISPRYGEKPIAVMYVDEAKGIEFDRVYAIDLPMEKNEKYIAYTRALDKLIIVR